MINPIFDLKKITLLSRVSPIVSQCVQAHKKPRWLPVAKSKIFRIPKRPVISEEERLELLRVHNNYKTQMRAISWYYNTEMLKECSSLKSQSSEEIQKRDAEEWERCLKLNNEWNAKIKEEREMRYAEKLEKMEQYALSRIEAKDNELQEQIKKASVEIKKQKELSSTFITPETLDAAIDHALANPTDYNYAIDLTGRKYLGRDTTVNTNTKDIKSASA